MHNAFSSSSLWVHGRIPWSCGKSPAQPTWPDLLPLSSGSMYDGLADNYNNYGTTSRNSYYSKFQAGNGSWGYPVRHHFHSKSWGALGIVEEDGRGKDHSGPEWEHNMDTG